MNQLRKLIIRFRILLRRHFRKHRRKSSAEQFVCNDDAPPKTSECLKPSVCEILAPNGNVIGTVYGGNARQRKIKMKNLTEVLVLFARLCNKSQMKISHKAGRVICVSKDIANGLTIELCIRKRNIPHNTVAVMSISRQRADIPVDKIYFCQKSRKML